MSGNTILINTAYFPPVNYFSLLESAKKAFIEREENYAKQTFRNRCYIYSANGPMMLTVPVLLGSFHKTPIKDIRVDYSKRWQQIHRGALISSYRSSPFFEYYFHLVENIIARKYEFLLDLNLNSIEVMLDAAAIKINIEYTNEFIADTISLKDYRNIINPKDFRENSMEGYKKYNQVFGDRFGFIPGLSILDLIFNTGPDAREYLIN